MSDICDPVRCVLLIHDPPTSQAAHGSFSLLARKALVCPTGGKVVARLPYLDRDDLLDADRFIWDDFVRVRGTEPGNIHRVIANAPNLLHRFVDLANELRNGTQLDPKLRELALLTVGRL